MMRCVPSSHPARLGVVETLKDFLMLSMFVSITNGNLGNYFSKWTWFLFLSFLFPSSL